MNNYYNIGAKYEIIGRIVNKTSVIAYMIRDKQTGVTSPMEKAVVEQLALGKQIYNCTAQIYNNMVNLKGINCKLSQLPRYNMDGSLDTEVQKQRNRNKADLKLIGKVQNGRVISDYILVSIHEPNKPIKINRNTVIELAKAGRIINAKSQMNCGEAMLRGVAGFNIAQLKTYQM